MKFNPVISNEKVGGDAGMNGVPGVVQPKTARLTASNAALPARRWDRQR
jgi:hypothetical protein